MNRSPSIRTAPPPAAVIFAPNGAHLEADEERFFRAVNPYGFILFSRNCHDRHQLRALIAHLRDCCDHAPVILIDQEGGDVARLRPPHWHHHPGAMELARLGDHRITAIRLNYGLIGAQLRDLGINVNCAPVLDLPSDEKCFMWRRSFGRNPDRVARMGRACAEALIEQNVLPVIKHIPGHGRTKVDSHRHLPYIDAPLAALEADDFLPFRRLRDMPMAMIAHIAYQSIDKNMPATWSSRLIDGVIRTGIGFDGLLISDDIDMKALDGSLDERAKKALTAGCDIVLQCSGQLADMQKTMQAIGPMGTHSLERAAQAEDLLMKKPCPIDTAATFARLQSLLDEHRS